MQKLLGALTALFLVAAIGEARSRSSRVDTPLQPAVTADPAYPYFSTTGTIVSPTETYTLRITAEQTPPTNPRTVGGVMQVHIWRTNGEAYCELKMVTLAPGAYVDTPLSGADFPRHNVVGGVLQPEGFTIEDWPGYSWRLTRSDGVVLNTGGPTPAGHLMLQAVVPMNCN